MRRTPVGITWLSAAGAAVACVGDGDGDSDGDGFCWSWRFLHCFFFFLVHFFFWVVTFSVASTRRFGETMAPGICSRARRTPGGTVAAKPLTTLSKRWVGRTSKSRSTPPTLIPWG